ncbi:uncharacterized protein EAF01_008974 [Botrytis porri]|uniref:Uncharacterized protein n=1 Tax=Botrytis porri TaxID=87229 RepID=A0A4Z1KU40_9HELO|nr:uncharacterized protein EAF01_008974 [Botrytis porri]KAF7898008.1 hypothetical protein EAF01_008974 [Botrytis porri]TGO88021.1 hypothetical protein BPOR_0189g00090 [Botrytis porri]
MQNDEREIHDNDKKDSEYFFSAGLVNHSENPKACSLLINESLLEPEWLLNDGIKSRLARHYTKTSVFSSPSHSFTRANVENVDQDIKQPMRNKVLENAPSDPAPFPLKLSKELSHDTTHLPKAQTPDYPLFTRCSERRRQTVDTTAHAYLLR